MEMKNAYIFQRVLIVGVIVFAMVACSDDFSAPDSPTGNPISSVAALNDNFNILTAVLNKTGQFNALNNNNSGAFTVFAPSDAAFFTYFKAAVPGNTFASETDVLGFVNSMTTVTTPSISTLNSILTYHLLSSKITSDLLIGNQVFATLNGARLSISKGSSIVLNANSPSNGATVTALDAIASNGVIHTIDRVMVAVSSANVLTPFGLTVSYTTSPATVGGGTTVGTASNYELMAVAIRRAGLAPTLIPNSSPLPDFTIFSPTDAAFQTYLAIPVGMATEGNAQTAINALDPTALASILKYHIVAGRILSTDLTDGQQVNTLLESNNFTVGISGSTITLKDKNAGTDPVVTLANVLTNSGIVHQINGVLKSN